MILWDPDVGEVVIKRQLGSISCVKEVAMKRKETSLSIPSLALSPRSLGTVASPELMHQTAVQTRDARWGQGQLGGEAIPGRKREGLIPDERIWGSHRDSPRGGCGLGLSVPVGLWLYVTSKAGSGPKGPWWTGEKPALQPPCPAGFISRPLGTRRTWSAGPLWTLWVLGQWSQFFNPCGCDSA